MSTQTDPMYDWIKNKKLWQMIHQPVIRAFQLQPNQEIEIPYADYKYQYPVIALLDMGISFDNPLCGVRFWGEPDYDSLRLLTVQNLATAPNIYVPGPLGAVIPPNSPPGIFVITQAGPFLFEEFLQLSVFNSDTVAHWYLGGSWDLAVIRKEKHLEAK